MNDAAAIVVKRLRTQSESCRMLGSELYATLLGRSADDAERGGPVLALLEPHARLPWGGALALRFMGAVHRLVLERRAPELAPFYPSVGGQGRIEDAWPAFLAVVEEHVDELRPLLERTVQTNEVGRSAGLLNGFFRIASATKLPLRVLEVGSSAGLNLRWDRYRYEFDGAQGWGDVDSPVVLRGFTTAPVTAPVEVASRAGCDPAPIDPTSPEGRLTLSSYVWPDQTWRWEQLRGALQVAAEVPADVVQMPASEFLERELADVTPGITTVVFHSVVIQYMEQAERDRVIETIVSAGERASSDAPVAWLRMEPPSRRFSWADAGWRFMESYFPDDGMDDDLAQLHLNVWPHAPATTSVGKAGYHGRPVVPT